MITNNKKPDYSYAHVMSGILVFVGVMGVIGSVLLLFMLGWPSLILTGVFSVVVACGLMAELLIDISHQLWHLRFPNEKPRTPGESLQGWKAETQNDISSTENAVG